METGLEQAAESGVMINPKSLEWQKFQETAHRFIYTEKIINMSGDEFSMTQYKELLRNEPNAVVLHNRQALQLIAQNTHI